MNSAIAVETTDKIAKMMRLIFCSNRPGEVAAAVDATKRLLASENVDGHWLADSFKRGAKPIAVTPDDVSGERDDKSAAWFCFHRRWSLSPKERLFIENIVRRASPLTPRQSKWVHDICDRLEGA